MFLRYHTSTPDTLKIKIATPGGTLEYDIPVMKSQRYSLNEIFEKDLLLLIPYYIFSHEKQFEEYEKDKLKLEILLNEYEHIKNKLEDFMNQKVISEYIRCTLIDMSNKVLEHIAAKYKSIKEGVKSVMGGKVLEYEAKTIKREGIKEGLEEGLKEGIKEGIKGTVSILRNLGIPQQTILSKIQEQYNLSPEASEKYL